MLNIWLLELITSCRLFCGTAVNITSISFFLPSFLSSWWPTRASQLHHYNTYIQCRKEDSSLELDRDRDRIEIAFHETSLGNLPGRVVGGIILKSEERGWWWCVCWSVGPFRSSCRCPSKVYLYLWVETMHVNRKKIHDTAYTGWGISIRCQLGTIYMLKSGDAL